MIDQHLSQPSEPLIGSRAPLSTRGRFILLIVLFNVALLVTVFLSIRNQEVQSEILRIETINVEYATRLAVVKRTAAQVVYVTATFTAVPATEIPSPSPTPTFTSTPVPPTTTPSSTPTPIPTSTGTSTPTPTRQSTDTPTSTATPTATAALPTFTPTPTATPTHTSTPPSPTPTFTATPVTPTSTPTFTPTPITPLPPTVLSVTPGGGGNESVVSVSVNGANFQPGQPGTAVFLRRDGTDLMAFNTNVVSPVLITCQFDLIGAVPDAWDVIVINPDSQSGTLPNGFIVRPELHHFVFSPIGNQAAGVPFPVTITAHDRFGNLVTDFTGTAALSDSTSTVSPGVTGNFTGGAWTGNLTITLAQTGVAVTATSGGPSGTSNSFDVSHGPLEHFGFGAIASPQTYDVPFSIAITAYDAYNNVVTSYADTADLDDLTGTLNPPVSGAFSSGTWSGAVTVAQVQAGDVITAISSISPTMMGVSNPFTVAYPAPSVTGILPTTGVNTGTTAVTLAGASFFPTPSARLGVVPLQNVTYVNDTTLNALVPAGIAAGTYDLYVSNPGPLARTGILTDAFTVENATISSTTLETSFLTTYGISPTAGTSGDNDSVQVLFFEVPDTLTDTLYVRIFDPDLGPGFVPSDEPHDARRGNWDTTTTFSLYGGTDAYSDPDARQATFTTPADPGIDSGTFIVSETFAANNALNGTWYLFASLNPAQGEHVGGKRIFKLSVVGGPGDDGNYYNIAFSTSSTENIAPQGARILAYSWTFRLAMPGTVPLYPYVSTPTTTFTQNNFDFDHLIYSVGITIVTPIRSFDVPALSDDGQTVASTYDVTADERNSTWTVLCFTTVGNFNNDVVFWATDQGGMPLALFTRSTIEPPPQ